MLHDLSAFAIEKAFFGKKECSVGKSVPDEYLMLLVEPTRGWQFEAPKHGRLGDQ